MTAPMTKDTDVSITVSDPIASRLKSQIAAHRTVPHVRIIKNRKSAPHRTVRLILKNIFRAEPQHSTVITSIKLCKGLRAFKSRGFVAVQCGPFYYRYLPNRTAQHRTASHRTV